MEKTRILIVDDHPAMRHGLAALIDNEADLAVCGEVWDRLGTLKAIQEERPDFVILDISLNGPAYTGLDLIQEIRSLIGAVPVLIYSMHDEMIYAERALRYGAQGYLMKQAPVRHLIVAIRRILEEGMYVSDAVKAHLSMHDDMPDSGRPLQGALSPKECLSGRELEVFVLIGKGHQPRDIAEKLSVSVKTVETHRMNIRKKLGIANASELTRYAVAWLHG